MKLRVRKVRKKEARKDAGSAGKTETKKGPIEKEKREL